MTEVVGAAEERGRGDVPRAHMHSAARDLAASAAPLRIGGGVSTTPRPR